MVSWQSPLMTCAGCSASLCQAALSCCRAADALACMFYQPMVGGGTEAGPHRKGGCPGGWRLPIGRALAGCAGAAGAELPQLLYSQQQATPVAQRGNTGLHLQQHPGLHPPSLSLCTWSGPTWQLTGGKSRLLRAPVQARPARDRA